MDSVICNICHWQNIRFIWDQPILLGYPPTDCHKPIAQMFIKSCRRCHSLSVTDHRSLEWLEQLKENNVRLTHQSLALQPYDFVMQHLPGKDNGNIDVLSQITTNRKRGEECE